MTTRKEDVQFITNYVKKFKKLNFFLNLEKKDLELERHTKMD